MTEADWLRCTNPREMLTYLGRDPVDRKFRLFACACCRRFFDFVDDDDFGELLEAVRLAEQFADGEVGFSEALEEYSFTHDHIGEAVNFLHQLERMLPYDAALAADQVVAALESAERGFDAVEERAAQCALLRDIIGNPFRPVVFDPAWRTGTVTALAEVIYADRAFDRLPILADALEDAGCAGGDVLEHCRQPGDHALGCWVIDLALGQE